MKQIIDYRKTIKKVTLEMDLEEYQNLMWIIKRASVNVITTSVQNEALMILNQIKQSNTKTIWNDEDI